MDPIDVRKMLEFVHQKKCDSNKAVRNIVEYLTDKYVQLTMHDFRKECKDNPSICAPVISLQFHLRKQVVGDMFWQSLCSKRERDERMAPVEFVYQCMKDCEANREANERKMRLASLSKQKSGKIGNMSKTPSSSRLNDINMSRGSSSYKLLDKSEECGADKSKPRPQRQKSSESILTDMDGRGSPSGKLRKSKSKRLSKNNNDDTVKRERPKSAKIAQQETARNDSDNNDRISRQKSTLGLTYSPEGSGKGKPVRLTDSPERGRKPKLEPIKRKRPKKKISQV